MGTPIWQRAIETRSKPCWTWSTRRSPLATPTRPRSRSSIGGPTHSGSVAQRGLPQPCNGNAEFPSGVYRRRCDAAMPSLWRISWSRISGRVRLRARPRRRSSIAGWESARFTPRRCAGAAASFWEPCPRCSPRRIVRMRARSGCLTSSRGRPRTSWSAKRRKACDGWGCGRPTRRRGDGTSRPAKSSGRRKPGAAAWPRPTSSSAGDLARSPGWRRHSFRRSGLRAARSILRGVRYILRSRVPGRVPGRRARAGGLRWLAALGQAGARARRLVPDAGGHHARHHRPEARQGAGNSPATPPCANRRSACASRPRRDG